MKWKKTFTNVQIDVNSATLRKSLLVRMSV